MCISTIVRSNWIISLFLECNQICNCYCNTDFLHLISFFNANFTHKRIYKLLVWYCGHQSRCDVNTKHLRCKSIFVLDWVSTKPTLISWLYFVIHRCKLLDPDVKHHLSYCLKSYFKHETKNNKLILRFNILISVLVE